MRQTDTRYSVLNTQFGICYFCLMKPINYLQHPDFERLIREALAEDVGTGDHTTLSTIPATAVSAAKCLVKEAGVIAGIEAGIRVFSILDPQLSVKKLLEDGAKVAVGDIAFTVSGPAQSILIGERLVLNIMQRMSGIATRTNHLASMIADLNCKLLDTRKTTPNFRLFEKWAVKIGGGENHRYGLFDMILIKDNHVDYAGGIRQALQAANQYRKTNGLEIDIEIETRTLSEVEEVLAVGGAERILLDNMDVETLRSAVKLVAGRTKTEASGNITELNIRQKAETGVDFISMGALTHSVKSLDISLKAIT